jgi:hypothetical protein
MFRMTQPASQYHIQWIQRMFLQEVMLAEAWSSVTYAQCLHQNEQPSNSVFCICRYDATLIQISHIKQQLF